MKAFTDIEQCKKLEEILPIESADMMYIPIMDIDSMDNVGFYEIPQCHPFYEVKNCKVKHLPCWSLSALLDSVKYNTINLHYNDVRNDWIASCTVEHSTRYESGRALNPIDACYEMIIKLHEQNLL